MGAIRRTLAAINDEDAIYDYIAVENSASEAADKLFDKINEVLGLLSQNPMIGKTQNHLRANTRRFTVLGNFLIFYEPQENGILILRLLHSKLDISERLFENLA